MRKNLGMLVPGPQQARWRRRWTTTTHVEVQRDRYRARRTSLARRADECGLPHRPLRGRSLYLWATRGETCWQTVAWLAERGILVAPGDFYGVAGAQHVRVALTATDERVAAAAGRLAASA